MKGVSHQTGMQFVAVDDAVKGACVDCWWIMRRWPIDAQMFRSIAQKCHQLSIGIDKSTQGKIVYPLLGQSIILVFFITCILLVSYLVFFPIVDPSLSSSPLFHACTRRTVLIDQVVADVNSSITAEMSVARPMTTDVLDSRLISVPMVTTRKLYSMSSRCWRWTTDPSQRTWSICQHFQRGSTLVRNCKVWSRFEGIAINELLF